MRSAEGGETSGHILRTWIGLTLRQGHPIRGIPTASTPLAESQSNPLPNKAGVHLRKGIPGLSAQNVEYTTYRNPATRIATQTSSLVSKEAVGCAKDSGLDSYLQERGMSAGGSQCGNCKITTYRVPENRVATEVRGRDSHRDASGVSW